MVEEEEEEEAMGQFLFIDFCYSYNVAQVCVFWEQQRCV